MKQRSTNTSNTKSNSSTKGKSKTFLGKWGEGWELGGALESISRAMHSSASRALDISVVVIDRMTARFKGRNLIPSIRSAFLRNCLRQKLPATREIDSGVQITHLPNLPLTQSLQKS